jgi:hypothetical protein
MTYEWWLFLFFKINILTYAETSDFLLAAVRSPLVILLCLLPLLLVWVLVRADQWRQRPAPAAYRPPPTARVGRPVTAGARALTDAGHRRLHFGVPGGAPGR